MRHSSADGIDQVGDVERAAGADAPVVERERASISPVRQVEQRQVPPAVRRDDGVDAPAVDVRVHPAHACVGASGHLEHVRHHVMRACVERVQRQRRVRGFLGALVLAALLEAERMHRQHGVVARQIARQAAAPPRRARACARYRR